MGNFFIDLDASIGDTRRSYNLMVAQAVRNPQAWIAAADFIYSINTGLPEDARVKAMPAPSFPMKYYGDILRIPDRARQYCRKWWPLINVSISNERSKMLREYTG